VLGVASDNETRDRYVTGSAVTGMTLKIGDNAAIHSLFEVDHDELYDTQLRAIAMLDLAFLPEP
jgi:hypothetical protein